MIRSMKGAMLAKGKGMALGVVQPGSTRKKSEGIRICTVRRLPRGVLKTDHAWLVFHDVWLPPLAPSAGLLSRAKGHADIWACCQTLPNAAQ